MKDTGWILICASAAAIFFFVGRIEATKECIADLREIRDSLTTIMPGAK